jgi:hypothetical protein
MPTSCITVRRSSKDGVYSYHVAEAHPPGQVDEVILWWTLDGYFSAITLQNGRPSIPFDAYNNWSLLKNGLMIFLHEELQCPEFDEGSRLRRTPCVEDGINRGRKTSRPSWSHLAP